MALITLKSINLNFPVGKNTPLKRMILDKLFYNNNHPSFMNNRVNYHVLKDINLNLEDGDRLAILGRNGAGKTTLLRTIAGIYEPDSGNIKTVGKIASLLNISSGMHMDSTGLENIHIKSAFLGMTKEETARVERDIIDFADLGEFIHLPIKKYSSGMMVRLAFAISTAMPVEILILDEWLSVGDVDFIEKCEERMESFIDNSSILVLASHSMKLLKNWCNKAIIIKDGEILCFSDDVEQVIESYIRG